MERSNENIIEFLTGQNTVSITAGAQSLVNKLKKFALECPEEVEVWENKDGSVFAHIPKRWVTIRKPREVSEEHKARAAENFSKNPRWSR